MVLILVSTIPTVLIGLVGKQLVAAASNTLLIPGICLLMTGILLLIADNSPEGRKLPKEITCKNGLLIGIARDFPPFLAFPAQAPQSRPACFAVWIADLR